MSGNNKTCAGLRVLLCAPYPPPFGGIASLMVSLCPGLQHYGAEDVVVVSFGAKDAVENIDGATVYRFTLRNYLWWILDPRNWAVLVGTLLIFRGSCFSLRDLLSIGMKAILTDHIANRHRCNVASFYQTDSSLHLLVCKRIWGASRGVALTVFGEIYDRPEFIKPRSGLFHQMIDKSDAVMSSSVHCANSFRQVGVNRSIEVIYVGVDLARFNDDGTLRKAYREQLNVDDNVPVLLFMGRFNVEMGLDSLISVIPELINRHGPLLKILLAGAKGPLCEAALKCQLRYPEQVVVTNDVPFGLLPTLYAAADIVLTPSVDQHACMGVTIKEAMAASRPVIGTNSGGIPEAIVHGETGLIVPLAENGDIDRDSYLAAILSLLADSQRLNTMGGKARSRAIELFSEETTVQRAGDVFMRCVPHA
jgi:glycosyltransferase involved in cell wall biosynthesis